MAMIRPSTVRSRLISTSTGWSESYPWAHERKIPLEQSVVQPISVPDEHPVPEPFFPAACVIFTYGSDAAADRHSRTTRTADIFLATVDSVQTAVALSLVLPDHRRQVLPFGVELHRQRIHAVAGVFGREPFAEENVSQVPAAVFAEDFGARTVGIELAPHGPRNFIVETGPAAMALEFVLGSIKRRIAAATDERAGLLQIGVFAGEGTLGSLPQDDAF